MHAIFSGAIEACTLCRSVLDEFGFQDYTALRLLQVQNLR